MFCNLNSCLILSVAAWRVCHRACRTRAEQQDVMPRLDVMHAVECSASTTARSKIPFESPKFLFRHKISLPPKRWKKSRKFRRFETNVSWTSIITLPEILGKLSRVPSMKVSGPHIFLCSSRGVGCLIIVEGSDGRRC